MSEPVSVLRDVYGRRYRVGESDRELLGHSRAWVVVAAAVAMVAVSSGQYGFGVIAGALARSHDWPIERTYLLVASWVIAQAVAVFPVTRYLERRRGGDTAPGMAISLGGVMCAVGLAVLAVPGPYVVSLLGYGVIGGAGAGLIYATCLGVAVRWFPERRALAGWVSGAFAYGGVPFIVAAAWLGGGPTELVTEFLPVAAFVTLAVVAGCAAVVREPPRDWWPNSVDPRLWAVSKEVNRGLRHNRTAIRPYTPAEAVHSWALVLLYVVFASFTAISLFNVAFVVPYAVEAGLGFGVGATALATLAAASGVSRALAGWLGDGAGRRRLFGVALLVGAAAQVVLVAGARAGEPVSYVVGAFVAGAAAGACYAVLPGLVEGYFGRPSTLPNFGFVYSAKAVGAVFGVALAAFAAAGVGFAPLFPVAAGIAVVAAGSLWWLRHPGLPALSDRAANRRTPASLTG